ncbi:hypothetical protein ACSZMI_01845 [Aeromonas veronii]
MNTLIRGLITCAIAHISFVILLLLSGSFGVIAVIIHVISCYLLIRKLMKWHGGYTIMLILPWFFPLVAVIKPIVDKIRQPIREYKMLEKDIIESGGAYYTFTVENTKKFNDRYTESAPGMDRESARTMLMRRLPNGVVIVNG